MDIIILIFSLPVLLFSVVIHEVAHGSVAYSLGDLTAKYQGRLTLNPIKHLDVFGSIILPLLLFFSYMASGIAGPIFGWAKPVPINPYNFKDQRWGSVKVALAGPASNLAIALFFGLIIRFLPAELLHLFSRGGFNIIYFIVTTNIVLALFNLIPIPPLDGSWLLFELLPRQFDAIKLLMQQYGLFFLVFFIFFGGLQFVFGFVQIIFHLITGV